MLNLITGLVEAFNINNCTRGIMSTNFTTDGNHITMIFDGGMSQDECRKYLENLRGRINGAVYQDNDGIQGPFNIGSFPFNANHGMIFKDKTIGKFKYEVPITDEVLFNLQAHLIYSMTKPKKVEIIYYPIAVKLTQVNLTKVKPRTVINTHPFDSNKYVMSSSFESKELAEEFKRKFCAEMMSLQYNLSSFVEVKVEVKGNNTYNNVYIKKDIAKDVDFIQKCVQYNAGKIGCSFSIPSVSDNEVRMLKEVLTQFIYHTTGVVIDSYYLTSYPGSDERSTLLPVVVVKDEKGKEYLRYLNAAEVHAINHAFGFLVINNLAACVSDESLISEQDKETYGIHGIDFFNKDICQCVFDTLFENALVTQVGKSDYGLEVQRSPHLDKLRARVNELYAPEAQLREQEAQLGSEEILSSAEAAQLQARTTISHTDAAKLCAEADQLYVREANLRVETIKSRAESAQCYAEASQLRAGAAQSYVEATQLPAAAANFRTEVNRLYAKVDNLNKEIEARKNEQKTVSKDTCKPWDQSSFGSIGSSSSDDNDHRRDVAGPSGGTNLGVSSGQGQSNSGTKTQSIPPSPPFPVPAKDQLAVTGATEQSKLCLHPPLVQKGSNSSSGCSSDHVNTAAQDSYYSSIKRGTPPRSSIPAHKSTPTAANQKKPNMFVGGWRLFFGGKSIGDLSQQLIGDSSPSTVSNDRADSTISIGSNNGNAPVINQGKGNVQSKLHNPQVEQGKISVKDLAV